MCYSAQIKANYRKYVRHFGADMSLGDFVELFYHRQTNSRIKVSKSLEAEFSDAQTDDERTIKALIDAFRFFSGNDARARAFQAAQASGRCRAEPALEDHQGRPGEPAHRLQQDRMEQGEA